MSIKARASIRMKLNSKKQLDTLLSALSPEAKSPASRRSHVELKKDGLFLQLNVEAEDTVALRATLNAYLRWIRGVVRVLHVLEGFG